MTEVIFFRSLVCYLEVRSKCTYVWVESKDLHCGVRLERFNVRGKDCTGPRAEMMV